MHLRGHNGLNSNDFVNLFNIIDSKSRSILNSVLLSTRKPRPMFVVHFTVWYLFFTGHTCKRGREEEPVFWAKNFSHDEEKKDGHQKPL